MTKRTAVDFTLKDQDGDLLELAEVGGFGRPMLALFVIDANDENDLCGTNLTLADAAKLIERLKRFTTQRREG